MRIFRDHGPREARSKCRLAHLIEDWGVEELRYVLCERLMHDLDRAGEDIRKTSAHEDHLGVQPQRQAGLFSVGLSATTGRVSAEQMMELARLSDVYGTGDVRLTTGQNAIVTGVAERSLTALLGEELLKEMPAAPSPWFRGLVACTGTDYCNLAQIETKTRAVELSRALEQRFGAGVAPLTMHWSGCPAACGNHQAADIGFRGLKANIGGRLVEAVAIYTGGRTGPDAVAGRQILDVVPCDEGLADVVAGIVAERTR